MKKNCLFFINIFYVCSVFTLPINIDSEKYPEFSKFVKKYRCSKEVEDNQNEHHLKGSDIERIINAERMKRCIEKNKLHHLRVADKCLCQTDLGKLEVLSQNVEFKKYNRKTKLSLNEVKDLVKLAEETGFRDWIGNFDWDVNDQITFYDTESNSYLIGMVRGVEGRDLPAHCKFNFVASLAVYQHAMEPEAKKWFFNRLNEVLESDDGVMPVAPLPKNTKYDNGNDLNFDQVKKEFSEWYKKHFW